MNISDFDHGKTKLDKINKYLEETFGFSIKQEDVTEKAIRNILHKVRDKQSEIVNESNVNDFHKHPDYAKTIMVAEALAIMLKEVSPTQRKIKAKVKESKMAKKVVEHKGTTPHKHPHPGKKMEAKQEKEVDEGISSTDPKTGKTIRPGSKEWASQFLGGSGNKDKFSAKNKKAKTGNPHSESVNPRSVTLANLRTLMEQDLDQAELVLAAKDMVDRLQKMAEDLASMQVEDLMPLVDAMRESFGTEQANAFSASADATLAAALETIKATREQMDQSVMVLTGEGAPANDMMGGEMPPAGDMGAEMAIPTEDEFAGEEAAAGVEGEPLGRIPKESVQTAKKLLLQHAKNGKLTKASIKEAAQILAQKKNS